MYHKMEEKQIPVEGDFFRHGIGFGYCPGKRNLTFPRFHRHLYKEEQDEIGGSHDHQDPTAIHGRI